LGTKKRNLKSTPTAKAVLFSKLYKPILILFNSVIIISGAASDYLPADKCPLSADHCQCVQPRSSAGGQGEQQHSHLLSPRRLSVTSAHGAQVGTGLFVVESLLHSHAFHLIKNVMVFLIWCFRSHFKVSCDCRVMCDSPAGVTAMLYKRPELLEVVLHVFCVSVIMYTMFITHQL